MAGVRRLTSFSMLASRLGNFDGLRVADLYAGSGALGLEALSRGAAHATFVEIDRAALKAIDANAAALGAADRISNRAMSVAALPPLPSFDLIFAAPGSTLDTGLDSEACRSPGTSHCSRSASSRSRAR